LVVVLNGPNMNMLGLRQPELYGTATLDDVEALCAETADRIGLAIDFRQSNAEGELISWVPVIEVHITNIHRREEFRQHSYISKAAVGVIAGLGVTGYALALHAMAELIEERA